MNNLRNSRWCIRNKARTTNLARVNIFNRCPVPQVKGCHGNAETKGGGRRLENPKKKKGIPSKSLHQSVIV